MQEDLRVLQFPTIQSYRVWSRIIMETLCAAFDLHSTEKMTRVLGLDINTSGRISECLKHNLTLAIMQAMLLGIIPYSINVDYPCVLVSPQGILNMMIDLIPFIFNIDLAFDLSGHRDNFEGYIRSYNSAAGKQKLKNLILSGRHDPSVDVDMKALIKNTKELHFPSENFVGLLEDFLTHGIIAEGKEISWTT